MTIITRDGVRSSEGRTLSKRMETKGYRLLSRTGGYVDNQLVYEYKYFKQG